MVTMMMKTATNIMQKLCAYLIFVFCCNAFGSMNGNSIVLPSHSHLNPHHHHPHQQHQHNNRHLHLNSQHSDESRLQLQLLQHNNSDVPTKKRINFYYSSLSRTQNTNPYNRMNENNKSHNIADESNVHKTIRSNPIANQTLQSQSNDETAFNANVAKFEQRNKTTISTKPSLNSLKLTLIQTNRNYPNFNRWPIATPQTTIAEPSYPLHGNDYGYKWKPANDQFVPSFKPTFESIPNPIGKTTTPTPNDFHTRDHRFHSKHHRGRHVCVEYKSDISSDVEQYRKNQHSLLCHSSSRCDSARSLLFYDNPNMIPSRRTSNHATYTCCAGWSKISKNSHGCTKPICKMPCKNNGKCIKPEQCSCPTGYTGTHCELDIDECITDKPCDQMCHNTDGSFYCTCRLGFVLHSDRQSCRKIDSVFGTDDTGTAFEARDLENDFDNDDLATRMHNIEMLMVTEKERNLETNKLIHRTILTFNNIKQRLETLESRQFELNLLRDRLKSYEIQTHKLEYTIDLLYKCRRKPLIYCPQLS